ncbi:hypothetical protein [Actinoplanes sp. NBRC 101535]|uniref:hypothetical protein n=1 Tax=Actinoplanes sp. NBRC 101535 TaxID=3032196 RepID=UPI002557AFCE|nr:hypothetical protein [Actinoplanes sp. NBRC 101535]
MSLWQRVRGEIAGAWRSIGYDLGRRREPPVSAVPGLDVTSTGMSTFPGSLMDVPAPRTTDARPPRRMVAVATFGLLAVAGAGGAHVAATRLFATPAANTTVAAPAAPAITTTGPADRGGVAGMGPGPRRERAAATVAAGRAAGSEPSPTGPATVASATVTPATRSPTARPEEKDCGCRIPPVPTPTSPHRATPASPSPTATASPTPSEDPESDPSTAPTRTAEPGPNTSSDTPGPDGSHRRAHREVAG